jgi:F0F1-type ATP synthase assembly protein I
VSGGPTDTEQKRRESAIIRAGRFGALGFEFAGTVVAGVIAGYYLDKWLHTAPLFTLLVTLAGMGGALYRLLWMLKRFSSQSDNGG